MTSDGQLIGIMSHTIGSIGQVMKDKNYKEMDEHEMNSFLEAMDDIVEIQRIYQGYIQQIVDIEENTIIEIRTNPAMPSCCPEMKICKRCGVCTGHDYCVCIKGIDYK